MWSRRLYPFQQNQFTEGSANLAKLPAINSPYGVNMLAVKSFTLVSQSLITPLQQACLGSARLDFLTGMVVQYQEATLSLSASFTSSSSTLIMHSGWHSGLHSGLHSGWHSGLHSSLCSYPYNSAEGWLHATPCIMHWKQTSTQSCTSCTGTQTSTQSCTSWCR